MKKILAVCMCLVVSICLGQVPPKDKVIKIDYLTRGENVPYKLYTKETCIDSSMKIVEYPMGPTFEFVKDSIKLSYHFELSSKKKRCLVSAMTLLEILDKDMNVVAQKTVEVNQFENAVQFHLFFKDPKFSSEKYFVQFKITTLDEGYVSTLARLPHRFPEQ
ncbi:MAG: hypothetical protein KBC42_02780 [Candidatus Pacebacteria bacterium]|nr:hypothetical protein [Candidatus Paceibacterota bacterium]MBP9780826.1 hypothetical protein [Candidatus Paceibacterota bacterium]